MTREAPRGEWESGQWTLGPGREQGRGRAPGPAASSGSVPSPAPGFRGTRRILRSLSGARSWQTRELPAFCGHADGRWDPSLVCAEPLTRMGGGVRGRPCGISHSCANETLVPLRRAAGHPLGGQRPAPRRDSAELPRAASHLHRTCAAPARHLRGPASHLRGTGAALAQQPGPFRSRSAASRHVFLSSQGAAATRACTGRGIAFVLVADVTYLFKTVWAE